MGRGAKVASVAEATADVGAPVVITSHVDPDDVAEPVGAVPEADGVVIDDPLVTPAPAAPVDEPSLHDAALADPEVAYACWRAIDSGRIAVAKAWERRGAGFGAFVRTNLRGEDVAVVAHTEMRGPDALYSARVGGQMHPRDLVLEDAKDWCDRVLLARDTYLL